MDNDSSAIDTSSMTLPVTIKGVSQRLEQGVPVLRVEEPNALTQVMGWLKFTNASGMVVARGQAKLHADILATGFRGLKLSGRERMAACMREYVDALFGGSCRCISSSYSYGQAHKCLERVHSGGRSAALVRGSYRAAIEPLLQHYGVRTRWLDVVDNIWIALWFACHKQTTTGRFAFHSQRSPAQEGPKANAYIAVMKTGDISPADIPGYWVGTKVRIIDLRYAVPSVYLRPHAQHGLLIAPMTLTSSPTGSLASQLIAYLEIPLIDALEWLGTGSMTSPHVLFPPAARDEGYRRLLEIDVKVPHQLGGITIYGPGY